MDLPMIGLAILLFVALYFLYVYLLSNINIPVYNLAGLYNYKQPSAVTVIDPLVSGNPSFYNTYRYSYAIWVNANNLGKNNDKKAYANANNNNIMYLVDTTTSATTNKWVSTGSNMYNNSNAIAPAGTYFSLDLYEDTSLYVSCAGINNRNSLVSYNFPLQKWTYVVVSFDNNIVDIYLDGKLVKSIKTDSNPSPQNVSASSMNYGTGDINVAGYIRYNYTMDPQSVWDNYRTGLNSMSSSDTFNLNLTVNKDNQPYGRFGKIPLF